MLKQLTFGVSCCERLFPNFEAFLLIESWDCDSKLRETVDKLWAVVGNDLAPDHLESISLQEIIKLAPETEDFSTIFTSLAGDAVAAVVYTIEAYQNQRESVEKLLLVSEVARNSIFEYLAAVNDPRTEPHIEDPVFQESIYSLPLMLDELACQENDISLLARKELNWNLVSQLRFSSARQGIQPVKRGIVKRASPNQLSG